MYRKLIAYAACLAVLCVAAMAAQADDKDGDKDDKKPKYTAKQVMKKAMKGGLCKKVASGKGSKEDKETLVAMFEALAKHKPKKGDAKSWKEKTSALVAAAKEVKEDKKGAGAKLGKAANCGACHKAHK